MSIRTSATLAILLALNGLPASLAPARAATSGVNVESYADCGQWVQSRTNNEAVVLQGYVIGLINGLALGHQVEFWTAEGRPALSQDAVFLWMDGFCRGHPLDDVVHGAVTLYRERSGWAREPTR
jgi:hypothetical protein